MNTIVYDRTGNGYSEDEKISDAKNMVKNDEFWCIICGTVKKVSIGVIASIEIGGWACIYHFDKSN